MGYMKDLLITVYGGGEDAVEAAKKIFTLGEWISVEERLPEAGVDVLIWSPIDSQFRRACVAALDRVNGQHFWTSEYGDEMPTHWMPLPEPPTN
jgi:tRNA nucleotidyltransferase (CCA-adding enzyme)